MFARVNYIALLFASFCSVTAAFAEPQASDRLCIIQNDETRCYSPDDLRQQLPEESVTVSDPVYKRVKKYRCFRLNAVMSLIHLEYKEDSILLFTALDGYVARLPIPNALRKTACLAFQDLEFAPGWESFGHGKETISPAPWYLVWEDPNKDLPWPYQIKTLTLEDSHAFDKLKPTNSAESRVLSGYRLFRQECLKCHSLNLEGGSLGPELNCPKNILEYRDRKILEEFIAHPQNFRAKSKMPAFEKILDRQAREDILFYLEWIGKRKASCGAEE